MKTISYIRNGKKIKYYRYTKEEKEFVKKESERLQKELIKESKKANRKIKKLREKGYSDKEVKGLTEKEKRQLKEGKNLKKIREKLEKKLSESKKVSSSEKFTIRGRKKIAQQMIDKLKKKLKDSSKNMKDFSKKYGNLSVAKQNKFRNIYDKIERMIEQGYLSEEYRRGGKKSNEIVSLMVDEFNKHRSLNKTIQAVEERLKELRNEGMKIENENQRKSIIAKFD